ncbi:MAG: MlaD family protein [Proteobacteria bacterium]|nr:MlaD family protein [Pseudomonadota bacterium]NLN62965.1 MCE family protein [Myxococcales bacterium]
MRDEKHLELKVGAMILIALTILVAFILILGDWSFGKRHALHVYFQNPGGLSAGVSVKVAGRDVGRISEMTYLGQSGPQHPVSGRPALVRTKLEVNDTAFQSLRADAKFYITTKGVLGDPFLEIDPGTSPTPIDASKPLFGTDPPRLDLLLADAAELIQALNRLLISNADSFDSLIRGGANVLTTLDAFIATPESAEGKNRIMRILENVENLTGDVQQLVQKTQEKYIDDPALQRTIQNMSALTGKLNRDIDPLLADVRASLQTLTNLGDALGPEEQKALRESLLRLNEIAQRANHTIARVDDMIVRMDQGKGTMGRLLKDDEIYDDLKELVRDIKRHPWKLIWEK